MTAARWWTRTWNPVIGCSHASPGCDHCYAERMAHRLAQNPATPQYRDVVANGRWTGKTVLVESALELPLRWRKPSMIFVCSMGDLFHESVPDAWIDRVFAVMALCPQHTFLVLTKRPERAREYFNYFGEYADTSDFAELMIPFLRKHRNSARKDDGWPFPNVWLGVTVEHPDYLWRVEELMQIPAAKRFVSVEPQVGPVDLSYWLEGWMCRKCGVARLPMGEHGYCDCPIPDDPAEEAQGDHRPGMLDWVIAGGETGPEARPVHPDWVRSLRDQCEAAGVPFLFKQWGEWHPSRDHDPNHARVDQVSIHHAGAVEYRPSEVLSLTRAPGWENMCRIGRAAAGRTLDGVIHDAYPEVDR